MAILLMYVRTCRLRGCASGSAEGQRWGLTHRGTSTAAFLAALAVLAAAAATADGSGPTEADADGAPSKPFNRGNGPADINLRRTEMFCSLNESGARPVKCILTRMDVVRGKARGWIHERTGSCETGIALI